MKIYQYLRLHKRLLFEIYAPEIPYLLERAPPFRREIFNERLPRMSAPLFSQKRRSFEKWYLQGEVHFIWEVHKKNYIIQLI